jgi:hypothetical protein
MTEPMNETPVLTRPALRAFVQAAQSQPIAPTRLTAHEVQRAWAQDQREQQRTRKVLAIGVALGLAAAAMVGLITTSLLDDGHDQDRTDEVARDSGAGGRASDSNEITPTLDAAIRVRSDAAAAPRVLGPWSIAIDGGIHQKAVQALAHRALRIELPERTLELVHGEMSIDLVGRSAVVRLESGTAAWVDAEGTRTQIQVERIELAGIEPSEPSVAEPSVAEPSASEPSASELAREAERQLIAGKRDEATRLLRKLVRKYPRAPESKAALMDLASQEGLAGDPDRARCAYQLYLERWPHSEVRAEINKQIAKLGEGPSCRGLDPR